MCLVRHEYSTPATANRAVLSSNSFKYSTWSRSLTFASVACCPRNDFAICHCPACSECLHLGTNIPMIHSFCEKMPWNNFGTTASSTRLPHVLCVFLCTFILSSFDMCCTHIVCTSRRFALRPARSHVHSSRPVQISSLFIAPVSPSSTFRAYVPSTHPFVIACAFSFC